MNLQLSLKYKLGKNLKPDLRQSTLSLYYETLSYLFFYLTLSEKEILNSYAESVLQLMLQVELEDEEESKDNKSEELKKEEHERQLERLKKNRLDLMQKEFSHLKK